MYYNLPELSSALDEARKEPIQFIENVFNCKLWQKQKDIINSVRDNRYTIVKSCYSSGKSFTAAQIAMWFLLTHIPSKIILTSSSHTQVQKILMSELNNVYRRSKIPLGGELTQNGFSISEDHFIIAVSPKVDVSSDAYRLEGHHSESVLVIIDQAQGVNPKIWEVANSLITTSSSRLLILGNPISKSGKFYDACKRTDIYHQIKISAFDTPNVIEKREVIPGLITAEWANDRKVEWGETHPLYISKVLAEFPEEDDSVLIPLMHVEGAIERELKDENTHSMGVDIARFGEDKTVIIIMRGGRVISINKYSQQDTMRTVGQIISLSKQYNILGNMIAIDESGIGGGVIDRLREQDIQVLPVNNGARAIETERFSNLGAELWWKMREAFENKMISIPDNHELKTELTSRLWSINSSGKVQVECKDDLKKRGLKSPDHADALALAIHAARRGAYNIPTVTIFSLSGEEED